METKVCSGCEINKELNKFSLRYKNGKAVGYQSWCKSCTKTYKSKWRLGYKKRYNSLRKGKFGGKKRNIRRERLLRTAKRRKFVWDLKRKPCADCERSYPPWIMDFDHREGETKLYNVSQLWKSRKSSWARLKAEVAKCDVICANCHRQRTYDRDLKRRGK